MMRDHLKCIQMGITTLVFVCLVVLLHSTGNVRGIYTEDESEAQHPELVGQLSCFSAIIKLEMAYRTERFMIQTIQRSYNNMKQRDQMDSFYIEQDNYILDVVDKVNHSHIMEETRHSSLRLLKHPVNTYHFIKRIVTVVNPLIKRLNEWNHKRLFYKELEKALLAIIYRNGCWLLVKDLEKSMSGLIRAFHVYEIPSEDMVSGTIAGYDSVLPLSLDETLLMLEEAYNTDHLHDSLRLVEYLLTVREADVNEVPNLIRRLHRTKANAFYKINDVDSAIRVLEAFIEKHPEQRSVVERDLKNFQSKKSSSFRYKPETPNPFINSTAYNMLCRGAIEQPHLYCSYFRPMKGWYQVKQELISRRPKLVRFLEVIHDSEIDALKKMAEPIIEASRLTKEGTIESIEDKSNYRISETAWISQSDSSVARDLSERVAFITGLATEKDNTENLIDGDSEKFQVLNYGFAGMYFPHYDVFTLDRFGGKKTVERNLDRVATWIYYLSNVEYGGATVFVEANITVVPQKGSAVLWYNIFRNGTRDYKTKHGGCPVVIGDKWISNKWMSEDAQMFIRPCSKRRYQKF